MKLTLMQEFVKARGWKIWDYRLMDDPVPACLRYEVLVAGDQRCALCAITMDMPVNIRGHQGHVHHNVHVV